MDEKRLNKFRKLMLIGSLAVGVNIEMFSRAQPEITAFAAFVAGLFFVHVVRRLTERAITETI